MAIIGKNYLMLFWCRNIKGETVKKGQYVAKNQVNETLACWNFSIYIKKKLSNFRPFNLFITCHEISKYKNIDEAAKDIFK